MAHLKIGQGYNVPIKGQAKKETVDVGPAPFVGVCPSSFEHVKPKLHVAVNDEVVAGEVLFHDKANPNLVFVAPASGRITAINYGARRAIDSIVIATSETPQYRQHDAYDLEALAEFSRDALIKHLMAGGIWPFIKQRPFNHIANPERKPKSIFINCMDSAPLANDPNYSLKDRADWFEAGCEAMKILADGKVHVVTDAKGAFDGFTKPRGVIYHTALGKHPVGLVGTHIARIDPINRGQCVWHIHARDLVLLGGFLLSGQIQTERIVAIAGPGTTTPRYVRSQIGAQISHLVQNTLAEGEQRVISGNVLTGTQTSTEGFLGYYDDLVTLVPEGREQRFLGWIMPALNMPSFTRALPTGFFPGKKFPMNTNINGGHRAIIQSLAYDRVVALDVHPEFLIKAAMAQDIDAMEKLGILECDPEDFALCSYVCPSKTEVTSVIKAGLELMEKEG